MINYCKIKPESVGSVKHIPDHLVFPFAVFMQNGGYDLAASKEALVFKRGKNIAKIVGSWKIRQSSYVMNEHCMTRFKVFLEMYVNQGAGFVNSLIDQGNDKLGQIGQHYNQHNYSKVA